MKMQGPDGRWLFGTVKVGEKGQIVIPKDAREMFGIRPGDMLMVGGEEGAGLAIFTSKKLNALFAGALAPENENKESRDNIENGENEVKHERD